MNAQGLRIRPMLAAVLLASSALLMPWAAAAHSSAHSSGFSGAHVGHSVGVAHSGFGGVRGAPAYHTGYARPAGVYRGGYPNSGYGNRGGSYGYYGGHGYHGGYGYRHGYYGCCGLGFGLFFAALPFYYSTLWWDGVPYYWADGNYYLWNSGVAQYETVPPPPVADANGAAPPQGVGQGADGSAADVYAYPKNGQSEAQQAQDKSDCHAWAEGQKTTQRGDFLRALSACLEGRGYSVQ